MMITEPSMKSFPGVMAQRFLLNMENMSTNMCYELLNLREVWAENYNTEFVINYTIITNLVMNFSDVILIAAFIAIESTSYSESKRIT